MPEGKQSGNGALGNATQEVVKVIFHEQTRERCSASLQCPLASAMLLVPVTWDNLAAYIRYSASQTRGLAACISAVDQRS